jgi:hypothetical protein
MKKIRSWARELKTKKKRGMYTLMKGWKRHLYRRIKGKEIIKKAFPPLIMKIHDPAALIRYSLSTD